MISGQGQQPSQQTRTTPYEFPFLFSCTFQKDLLSNLCLQFPHQCNGPLPMGRPIHTVERQELSRTMQLSLSLSHRARTVRACVPLLSLSESSQKWTRSGSETGDMTPVVQRFGWGNGRKRKQSLWQVMVSNWLELAIFKTPLESHGGALSRVVFGARTSLVNSP